MKKLKSLLTLSLVLCAAAPIWAEVDYSAGISGLYKTGEHATRYTSGLTLNAKSGDTTVSTKAITGLQNNSTSSTAAGAKIYWDKSSEKISLEAGQTLHVAPSGDGIWMQQYMYIDWAGDGFVYDNEDTYLETNTTPANKPVVKAGADLVYFSVHAKDVNKDQAVTGWYYFNGTSLTNGDQRNTSYTNQFDVTIPAGTPAGEYRARYKVDWRNLDPTGAVNGAWPNTIDLIKSGGVIVDFTIEITEPTPEPEPEPEVVLPEGPQVVINETNGTFTSAIWTSNATFEHGVRVDTDGTISTGTDRFVNGWFDVSPHGAQHTLTIESTDPNYYVKAFKFTAHTTEPRNVGTNDGTYPVDFVLTSKNHSGICNFGNDFTLYELELTESDAATFTIYCQNTNYKKVVLKDFVVVLAEKPITQKPIIEVSAADNHGCVYIGDDNTATSYEITNTDDFDGVTLHAVPNDGYRFTHWSLNGETVTTNANYTITALPGPHTWRYIAHFEDLYATGHENSTLTRSGHDRYTLGLDISDNYDQSLTISSLQANAAGSSVYFIKVDKVFRTQSGATMTVKASSGSSVNAMHRYVYIDRESDGFNYDNASTYIEYRGTVPTLKAGADLVYFSNYFANDNDTHYNSAGESDDNINGAGECVFAVPNLADGTYRCRYKVDWNNLDPKGTSGPSNSLEANGGIIVDFTIRIENPNPKQATYDALEAEIDKYVAAGFDGNAKWADGERTTDKDQILFVLETKIDDETSVEYFQSEVAAAREEILANITPKGLVRIFNHASSATNPIAMSSRDEAVYHSGDTGEKLGTKFPNFLWNIEYRGQGKFALKNHHSQKYVGNAAHETGHVAMSPEACDLELHFTSDGHFGLYTGENGYMAYPVGDANYLVENHSATTAQWRLEHFAGTELEDGSNESVELATKNTTTGDVTVIFQTKEGVDLTVLEDAYYEPAHMRITVSGPRANAPMRREASLAEGLKGTDLVCEDGEYSFTIPTAALGNYTINVPAGFFSTNDDLTAAQSIGLTVKADSATTSIAEVGVEAVDAEGVYDLQGRRLAAPVKGINIINGKKVLVK